MQIVQYNAMKIFITGGSGFFGWNATRYFSRGGHDVLATFLTSDRAHYLQTVAARQPVRLNVADRSAVEDALGGFRPDIIIHAAALAKPQEHRDPQAMHRVNVQGARNVADAAKQIGAGLVYISSDLVYPPDAGRVNEQTPITAGLQSAYGLSKLQGEQQVLSSGSRCIVLRPALMYGGGPESTNSFWQFITRCWRDGKPAPLFLDQFRSFVYVMDVCNAIGILTGNDNAWGNVFVCGGPEPVSRAEFGYRLARHSGVPDQMIRALRTEELPDYTGTPGNITLDSARLGALGWQPMTLEAAFDRMKSDDGYSGVAEPVTGD